MELCRVCYTTTNRKFCVNIFDEDIDPPIWKIIQDLSNLTILQNDPYTKSVCCQCLEQLKNFNVFRKMLLKSDTKIRLDSLSLEIDGRNGGTTEELISSTGTRGGCQSNDTVGNGCTKSSTHWEEPVGSLIKAEIKTEITDEYVEMDEMKDVGQLPLKIEPPTDDTLRNCTEPVRDEYTDDWDPTRPYKCDICHHQFDDPCQLKDHLDNTHTIKKRYNCDICGKKFTQLTSLKCHFSKHRGGKYYNCIVCGQTFGRHCDLSLHLKKSHRIAGK